jgi:hypothetical protein
MFPILRRVTNVSGCERPVGQQQLRHAIGTATAIGAVSAPPRTRRSRDRLCACETKMSAVHMSGQKCRHSIISTTAIVFARHTRRKVAMLGLFHAILRLRQRIESELVDTVL